MNKTIILGFSALIIIFLISAIIYNNARIKKLQSGTLASNRNPYNRNISGGGACESIQYNPDGSIKSRCVGYYKVDNNGYSYCDCSVSGTPSLSGI